MSDLKFVCNEDALKHLSEDTTVGEWYQDRLAEGVAAPLALCQALSQLMHRESLSFPQACTKLVDEGVIHVVGGLPFLL